MHESSYNLLLAAFDEYAAQQFRPTLPSLSDEEIEDYYRDEIGIDNEQNFLVVMKVARWMRDFSLNQSPVVGEGEKTAIEKKVDDFLEKMYPFANPNREYLKTHILKFCEAKNIY